MAITTIDRDLCIGCEVCVNSCPIDVIRMEGDKAVIKFGEDCMICFWCMKDCPTGAVTVEEGTNGYLMMSCG